jgi:hypothetical protein
MKKEALGWTTIDEEMDVTEEGDFSDERYSGVILQGN